MLLYRKIIFAESAASNLFFFLFFFYLATGPLRITTWQPFCEVKQSNTEIIDKYYVPKDSYSRKKMLPKLFFANKFERCKCTERPIFDPWNTENVYGRSE